MTGNAKLTAKVEEIVLDGRQRGAYVVRKRFAEQHAKLRIQLIDIADRRDPRVVLLHAAAIAEAGRAVVAGTRRYLAQAIAHDVLQVAQDAGQRPRSL